jgi:hypothetical protein
MVMLQSKNYELEVWDVSDLRDIVKFNFQLPQPTGLMILPQLARHGRPYLAMMIDTTEPYIFIANYTTGKVLKRIKCLPSDKFAYHDNLIWIFNIGLDQRPQDADNPNSDIVLTPYITYSSYVVDYETEEVREGVASGRLDGLLPVRGTLPSTRPLKPNFQRFVDVMSCYTTSGAPTNVVVLRAVIYAAAALRSPEFFASVQLPSGDEETHPKLLWNYRKPPEAFVRSLHMVGGSIIHAADYSPRLRLIHQIHPDDALMHVRYEPINSGPVSKHYAYMSRVLIRAQNSNLSKGEVFGMNTKKLKNRWKDCATYSKEEWDPVKSLKGVQNIVKLSSRLLAIQVSYAEDDEEHERPTWTLSEIRWV